MQTSVSRGRPFLDTLLRNTSAPPPTVASGSVFRCARSTRRSRAFTGSHRRPAPPPSSPDLRIARHEKMIVVAMIENWFGSVASNGDHPDQAPCEPPPVHRSADGHVRCGEPGWSTYRLSSLSPEFWRRAGGISASSTLTRSSGIDGQAARRLTLHRPVRNGARNIGAERSVQPVLLPDASRTPPHERQPPTPGSSLETAHLA